MIVTATAAINPMMIHFVAFGCTTLHLLLAIACLGSTSWFALIVFSVSRIFSFVVRRQGVLFKMNDILVMKNSSMVGTMALSHAPEIAPPTEAVADDNPYWYDGFDPFKATPPIRGPTFVEATQGHTSHYMFPALAQMRASAKAVHANSVNILPFYAFHTAVFVVAAGNGKAELCLQRQQMPECSKKRT